MQLLPAGETGFPTELQQIQCLSGLALLKQIKGALANLIPPGLQLPFLDGRVGAAEHQSSLLIQCGAPALLRPAPLGLLTQAVRHQRLLLGLELA